MVSRKQMPNGIVPITQSPALLPGANKLPSQLRFPLVVITNLALSILLYSFTADFAAGDLSSVSRSINEWWQVAGMLLAKTVELALGWWGQYDSFDLASLTLLSHGPPLYLLTTFYAIRPTTFLLSVTTDILCTYIPFRLFRPLLPMHSAEAPKGAVSNRSIINDWEVSVYNSLLAAGIYGLVVYGSFVTWLPVYLVTHFNGVRDISAAHEASLPLLMASFIPIGIAAKSFLFTPATGAARNLNDITTVAFNPQTATLWETIRYNVWGYSKRTRIMIKRTATLATVCFLHTWLQVAATVEGAETLGAIGWASVWSTAAILTGTVFWWVGHVDGVSN